ncbi:MAG TPA: hypothetical protein EYH02_05075 [Ignisphaera aggregans]|uniref:DNA-directed RNA polymerase subunit Rpo8 n=1 Tax=Ignisphaera aggregans TaxID=334771 RepID=A0A832Z108_9CREN|nr:hypothetical protein [Ignisphaera aggregans]
MSIKLRCKVVDVTRSYIPNIYILDLDCDRAYIKMDMHRLVMIVDKGDSTEINICKSLPVYEEGKDFLARGYVITKRELADGKHKYKVLISLWGFLIVLETNDPSIYSELNYMDEIYFHMKRI